MYCITISAMCPQCTSNKKHITSAVLNYEFTVTYLMVGIVAVSQLGHLVVKQVVDQYLAVVVDFYQ